jgi:MFS family permease
MADAPYLWLWNATLASNSGRYAVMLVASWLAFQLTRSPVGPGLVSFLAFSPALVVGPVAGVLADRVDRRRLIWLGAAIGAGATIVAAVAGAARGFDMKLVLLLAASCGVGMALEQPARVSLVPVIVRPAQRLNAFSLMRIPVQGAQFAGPVLTTGVLVRYGPVAALGVCTIMYALTGVLIARVEVPVLARPETREGVVDEIRTAIAYVSRERMLGILTLFVGAHCALTMAFMGVLPSLATMVLHGNDATFGTLMSAVGLGAVVGPLFLAWRAQRVNERRYLVATALLSGITLVALGLSRTLAVAGALATAAGATQALFMILIDNRSQTMSVDAMRGRVAAFVYFFTGGVMGIFNLLLSAMADWVGSEVTLAICGLAFVAATCGLLIRVPQLRWTPPVPLEEQPAS